ncbi:MAG TPA: nucleoside-diphosphate kinase [Candidatus Bipolaricaulis sp.]|jgi:nucleoside-diphosphate kinase|nr:nucleoside-diphosphate kinase [Candidatus Bipolaricaulis sp.]MDY0392271.1 nucleoside-diphosphate kinase [Candidatus Bipolaricaulis sp.]HPD07026.1 nucleoside-diphosphate kinase [Candidatus Bipolaricaulis sp.]HRS13932.1 nucleoside-diphosphate kinase [Candidatus Bipolaricaulis sp.]HRU21360.1 nucleoside-diphosphate kinase [Candidatus Bipolaricaulis sp.]
MERTLVLLKPDALQRRLVGPIIARFEAKGLTIVGMKLLQVPRDLAARHYAEHVGKPFYEELVSFITSAPVIALVVEGPQAIAAVRALMGKTNPFDAAPGTIRGDFGLSVGMNLVHGSDSPAAAAREIPLFFSPEEILTYSMADAAWLGG